MLGARALDLLGERWTLLIVRELLCGSSRFNDIRRGIPRISRTMLSARLRYLVDSGLITRSAGSNGPTYELTNASKSCRLRRSSRASSSRTPADAKE